MKTKIKFLAAIAALGFVIGCSTITALIPVAVPAATYAILNNNPGAVKYVSEVAVAVSAFASQNGAALSPENLQLALSTVPVPGISPEIVNAIYGVVVIAYTPIYDRYVSGKIAAEQVRSVLAALSAGLKTGVAEYQRDHPEIAAEARSSGASSLTSGELKSLANAMAADLERVK